MNISIKRLEKNLGYKIKKNIFVLAVDTATTSGIALVNIDVKNVKIDTLLLKIPSVAKDSEDKADAYEQKLNACLEIVKDFKEEYGMNKENLEKLNTLLVLENSFLKMNVVTFGFLRALQGIFYAELAPLFKNTRVIFPTTARNLVGFHSTLPRGTKGKDKKKEIMNWISNVVEYKLKNDNEADALLLALAGLKE